MGKPPQFDIIVVHSFSRFFRDHFELEFYVRKLAKNGVKLISITQEIGDDPVHVMMRQIMALFDEYQSKENAKHTLRAMKENARQGFSNGGRTPVGYRLVFAEQRGMRVKKKLEIDPVHGETVRLIFRLANFGDGQGPLGVKAIASHLNKKHLYTPTGARWGVGAVHQVLTRRAYIGEKVFNRHAKDGRINAQEDQIVVAVPPLIDSDLFDAVQAKLRARDPQRMNGKVSSSSALLTGVLHCSECGGSMAYMTGKHGAYRYYVCGNRRRKGPSVCSAGAIRADLLEDVVIEYVEDRLLCQERLEVILNALLDRREERVAERRAHAAELSKVAAELQQRLSRLYEAIESGVADLNDPDLTQQSMPSKQSVIWQKPTPIMREDCSIIRAQCDS
jgi:DNA invertase Pin-like site-specific DNA recombinase